MIVLNGISADGWSSDSPLAAASPGVDVASLCTGRDVALLSGGGDIASLSTSRDVASLSTGLDFASLSTSGDMSVVVCSVQKVSVHWSRQAHKVMSTRLQTTANSSSSWGDEILLPSV
jgi:hypothetical protein